MSKSKRLKKAKTTEEQMQTLATATGLTHDGGDDNRLFAETIYTHSSTMSEAEYDAMEEALANYELQGAGFIVSAWNDESGYNYWTVKQDEDNYIQVTAYITDATKVNPNELKAAVEQAYDKFYCDWND